MEIASTAYHALSAFLVFMLGLTLSVIIGRKFGLRTGGALILYVWHTLFSMFYCWYVLNSGGDALSYFRWGQNWAGELQVGTAGVVMISGILVNIFGLSLIGAFLVFNIFGQIGLLAFWASLKAGVAGKPRHIRALATLIVFLPSVSFWSSALGKDAISFMATGLALWSSINLSRRSFLMVFAISAMFFVRPHMAGFMVMAIAIAVLVDSNVSVIKKIVVAIFFGAVAAVLIPFALKYAGLSAVVSVESVAEYIDKRQTYNVEGGG
ncbi:hypothetical protein, partial [Marinobacter sp. VGCF2001]|uniref:hypothetical protein n=1 Tax=Marinobacter sp. VGCF2001 TaxID=3417189 RepID=UPI003CED3654